jgi:hypothetical protein
MTLSLNVAAFIASDYIPTHTYMHNLMKSGITQFTDQQHRFEL